MNLRAAGTLFVFGLTGRLNRTQDRSSLKRLFAPFGLFAARARIARQYADQVLQFWYLNHVTHYLSLFFLSHGYEFLFFFAYRTSCIGPNTHVHP
jgi:hypothetical protein